MCVEYVKHTLFRFCNIIWQQVNGVYAFQCSKAVSSCLAPVELSIQNFNKEISVAASWLQKCSLWSENIFAWVVILKHIAHLLDDETRGVDFPMFPHSVFAFC